MRLNISSKIIILLSATIVIVLSIAFHLIISKESEKQFNEMRKDALAISTAIQESVGKIMSGVQSDRDYMQTLTEHLGSIAGVKYVEIFNREAIIIAHTDKERVGGKPLEIHKSYIQEIFKNGKPIEEEDKPRGRYNRFVPVYDTSKKEEETVIGVVELVLDMNLVLKKVASLRLKMILTVIVLILILLGLNLWFLRKIVVLPIRKLLDMTKKVAKGNLAQRLELTSHDELGQLSTSFNKMVEDLETTTTSIANLNEEIRERQQAEKDLMESEARFRSLIDDVLDNSAVGIFILDADFRIVWINKVLELFFGLCREEIIGKDKRQTIREKIQYIFDDPDTFKMKVFATYDDNSYIESFECHVLSEGKREERWLVHQSMPIKSGLYEGGRIEHYHDITERKKAEERTKSIAHILEDSLNEIYIFDAKTLRFIQVNKGARLNLGYSMQELSNLTPLDLKPEFTAESFAKMVEPLRTGKQEKIQFVTVHRRKDNSLYDIEVHLQLSTFQSVQAFVAIILDITERKKMENKLSESELRLMEMAENITSVFWMEDTEGNLLYTSPAYEQIWGRTCQSFYENPKSWLDAIHPEDRQRTADSFSKWKLEGEYNEEFRIIRPDGDIRWIHDRGYPIRNKEGETYRIAGIAEDITERKKMEETLLQSEKLKSIGTITSGIAHEFNNILAIISGNIQLLARTYKDQVEITDALSTIKRATDDGAEISSKMLEFTKTSQDTKKLVSSDIRDLIMQSIDFTTPRWKNEAQARGINYKINTKNMKSISPILCNPTELREIFINIIINALDAMPEGGILSFCTWSGDDTVFVGISDTGKGMSEDVKKNVFDPFFTTKNPVGTGLGMSMAYGIIRRHGGKIEVESELGNGSTFTLQFPTTTETVSPVATPEPEQGTNKKNLCILVVDDEEAICDMLDQFFSGSGHKVKTVDNGADAINIIKTEYFDLVLCDLAMPDVSGRDVVKMLNELENMPKIGIITGWCEESNPVISEEFKVDFVVRKPFDFSELAKQINDVFDAG